MVEIEITSHARQRMRKYNISDALVKAAIDNPTDTVESYGFRKIYQKRLNGYVLRIIIEEGKAIRKVTVITVYKAKSGRYEI